MSRLLPVLCFIWTSTALRGADPAISADRIRADVETLSSDRFEGRGPGTRGGELTADFLAAEFTKIGLKPAGDNGTYFQPVPLLRVVTSPKSTLQAARGDQTQRRAVPMRQRFPGDVRRQQRPVRLIERQAPPVAG